MKKLSLIALLILMMTVVSFQGFTQEVVYIEVYEYTHKNDTPKIVTITPDNEVEITPLIKISYSTKKDEVGNAPVIKKELEKWIQKGFEIKTSTFSTISGGPGSIAKFSNYVLVK